MKFDFVTLYVKDMAASLEFYHQLLGLTILRRFSIENGEIVFVGANGQPAIELIAGPDNAQNTYSGFSIGIEVASLDEATARLGQAGFPVIRGPVSPDGATRFSFIQDPNGIEVELIEYR
ncbi:MAG: VOC family protein [Ruminococcaceae bacterium]|nr:VOC family protein [Oscillospiraceae bacterium]